MKKADKIMSGFSHEIEKWKGMGRVVLDGYIRLTFFLRQLLSADVAFVGHECGICHR